MLISILLSDPILFFAVALALVISLSIHEFAHAYISMKLGDYTAKYLGRVTLNPTAHLDPVGTVLLLIAGFGWGKPVPFNPLNLKNPKRDAALISIAGPMSNFILAVVFSIFAHIFPQSSLLGGFVYLVVYFNLALGIFNLIPIHPLDGFKVVNGILPDKLSVQWIQMAPYGIYLLLLIVVTGVSGNIISPIMGFLLKILGL